MAVHNFVDVLLHPRCLKFNKCLSAFRHFSQMAVFHPYCHSSFRLCLGDGGCVGIGGLRSVQSMLKRAGCGQRNCDTEHWSNNSAIDDCIIPMMNAVDM